MSESYTWQLLRAGHFRLDGGGMFGVVPRSVWARSTTPDAQNRIPLQHNCLLLRGGSRIVLVEAGSGDKFDEKNRQIFALEDRSVEVAVRETGTDPGHVTDCVITHLHFDHAGGLTRRPGEGEKPDFSGNGYAVCVTFPSATVHVQRREWDDARANNSVMTRTYLPDHLEPLADRLSLCASLSPVGATVPSREWVPSGKLEDRCSEILPGVRVFLVPGHTWGQQAVWFKDDQGRGVVFTPDVMPTVNHVGAAYSMAYDVEPYISMLSRRWFLREACERDWLLVLDHEPGNPLVRVREDGKGWYRLVPEEV
jgi:glyoxylase-like metal-dependent hydrolase (beta-lactamase superfamily II)